MLRYGKVGLALGWPLLTKSLERLEHRHPGGMGGADVAVLIKFPSFRYFPEALASGRGLISVLLLLIIFFLAAISLLERLPAQCGRGWGAVRFTATGFPAQWLICPFGANPAGAVYDAVMERPLLPRSPRMHWKSW